MNKTVQMAIGGLVLAALLWLGYGYWQSAKAPAPASAPVVVEAPPPAPAPAASADMTPAVRFPISNVEGADAAASGVQTGTVPASDDAVMTSALNDLLGNRVVLALLQTDGFAARVAATVDNLGRQHAAPRLWPVNPAPGRFTVTGDGEAPTSGTLGPANHARYDSFVSLVDGLDAAKVVALYVRLYPQFQRAFEELGYSKQHFNDRLVDVVDQLLATPEPVGPVAVQLTPVKGPMKPTRPWVLYAYADPAFRDLQAGQKILLRMSVDQRQRLKAKLQAIRTRLVTRR